MSNKILLKSRIFILKREQVYKVNVSQLNPYKVFISNYTKTLYSLHFILRICPTFNKMTLFVTKDKILLNSYINS